MLYNNSNFQSPTGTRETVCVCVLSGQVCMSANTVRKRSILGAMFVCVSGVKMLKQQTAQGGDSYSGNTVVLPIATIPCLRVFVFVVEFKD